VACGMGARRHATTCRTPLSFPSVRHTTLWHHARMTIATLVNQASEALIAEMNQVHPPGPIGDAIPNEIPELLRDFAAQLEAAVPVLSQATSWDARAWHDGISERMDVHDDAKSALLDAVASLQNDTPDGKITRRFIFDLRAADDPIRFFVAVMAWGFPETGYGWWRTASMANKYTLSDFRGKLMKQIGAATTNAATAWQSWTSSAKIRGLGTAFASKLAYFAGMNPSIGHGGPLIADRNTAWAIWAFVSELRDTRTSGKQYSHYVETLERWAGGGRADTLEHALFRLRPAVIKKWQRELQQ
jgi:hypothetical protein